MSFNALVMSGLPGSGKSSLLSELHRRLGWEIHGIGQLLRRDYQKWFIQDYPRRKDTSFTQYYSDRKLVPDEAIRKLNDELRGRLSKGEVLADSRFAILNARGLENVRTVYLHAPIDVRAARSMGSQQYEGLSPRDIKNDLIRRQGLESERGKEIYGPDFECHDFSGYDLAINTSRLSIEQEADLLLSLLG